MEMEIRTYPVVVQCKDSHTLDGESKQRQRERSGLRDWSVNSVRSPTQILDAYYA
jgi:hypothetical protein